MSVMLYPCMLCACELFGETIRNMFGETIRNMFGGVNLLLNVMGLLCVVGDALFDIPCMVFHIMCVLCMWSQ